MGSGGRPAAPENTFVTSTISNRIALSGANVTNDLVSFGRRRTKGTESGSTLNRLVGWIQWLERVETTNVPGATTSGLNRPPIPSSPSPTLPTLENGAISLFVSVKPSHGWLVISLTTTSLVMLRKLLMAPTVMTFL